jgi:hypothetical protein
MYPPKKLAINSIGLIVFIFGAMLFLWGVVGTTQVGQTPDTAQSSVIGAMIGIIGIVLLWRGSKVKVAPIGFHTG